VSFKDQLLKAGLVDKKKVQQANRHEKDERRAAQGHRDTKAELEAHHAAAVARAREAQKAAALAEQQAREARKAEQERARQLSNLLRAYRVRLREGKQLFFHRSADGRSAVRQLLAESLAVDLRLGRAAVCWVGGAPADAEYVVLPREAADRIAAIAPDRVLFCNPAPPPRDDLAERLYDMQAIVDSRARVADRWAGLR
jgi:uncharacterized protein YaiL (DUF2058 family)